ncbi:prepilin peptidase [Alkaliphilus hydrothermalis]|uniref:Leader peptidase (Prepilin peptidase)/N-methyltransferase n=1 Tax=Alkaliphilus hydrothermalis TaxID=1482730 RepID=A0ABS2NTA9_9FIRM|nr:A24 family peptidase [Alkaliphilus hydrothermalis]MBM7615819.1 leader peptidase (prepilin peptidase)/N-methyltransferase [Alkaliphilus hydrothermalis]
MNWSLVSYGILIIFLGVVAYYDFKSFIIPNKLLLAGGLIGLLLFFFNKDLSITSVLLGVTVVGGLALAIAHLTKGGLGLGDVKLLACLAMYVGLWRLLNIVLISSILSGMIGLVLLVFGRVSKKTVIPFAPFIFVSTILVFFLQ